MWNKLISIVQRFKHFRLLCWARMGSKWLKMKTNPHPKARRHSPSKYRTQFQRRKVWSSPLSSRPPCPVLQKQGDPSSRQTGLQEVMYRLNNPCFNRPCYHLWQLLWKVQVSNVGWHCCYHFERYFWWALPKMIECRIGGRNYRR